MFKSYLSKIAAKYSYSAALIIIQVQNCQISF